MRQRTLEALAEEGLEDRLPRHGHRHRHIAGRQPLRQADQVGHDIRLLHGEHRAGPPETGRHLVEDDEHAGVSRQLDQPLEEAWTAEPHAARALQQGLDDQRGDGVAAVGEQRLEGRQRAGFALFRRIVAVEGCGVGEHHDVAHQVAERAEQLRAAAERHGAERVAVIAAVEGDQRPAPGLSDIDPILIGDLERDLDRGRAVVGEEHA